MWFVSLPIVAVMIGLAWSRVPQRTTQGVAFLVVWTLLLLVILAMNFRTLFLARGRRAEMMLQALDSRDRADAPTAERPGATR